MRFNLLEHAPRHQSFAFESSFLISIYLIPPRYIKLLLKNIVRLNSPVHHGPVNRSRPLVQAQNTNHTILKMALGKIFYDLIALQRKPHALSLLRKRIQKYQREIQRDASWNNKTTFIIVFLCLASICYIGTKMLLGPLLLSPLPLLYLGGVSLLLTTTLLLYAIIKNSFLDPVNDKLRLAGGLIDSTILQDGSRTYFAQNGSPYIKLFDKNKNTITCGAQQFEQRLMATLVNS